MITCLIWLIIYLIVAVILVYVIETILGLWMTPPAPVFILIRCLGLLIVLLLLLNCLGLLQGMPLGLR